ncbi:DUF6585 family protein [Actinosynnema sp. NPDC020468]|uniref:DUF6585 family protein n=1 Tax=Actinosynnema sp. NPDC020468 TaxID=3154488 RepID=UPI00340C74AA
MADEHDLGQVRTVHRAVNRVDDPLNPDPPERSTPWALVSGIGLGACVVLPIVLGFVFWSSTGDPFTGLAIGVPIMFVGFLVHTLVEKRTGRLRPHHRVYQCDEGFVLPARRGKPARAFRWGDFTAVHREGVETYYAGRYVGSRQSYRLVRGDGVEAVFDGADAHDARQPTDVAEFGAEAEHAVARHALPEAARTVERGRTVRFGRLAVAATGITVGGGDYLWSEIRELAVSNGSLTLWPVRGRRVKVEVADVPNFRVFLALVEHLRGTR